MLAELAAQFPIVEETFGEASSAPGYDLWQLVQQGPAEELNKTWQTQPALLAASVAIFRVWQQQGGKAPALMAGHSLANTGAGLRRRAGLQGGDPSGRAARQADAGSGAGRHRRDVCHHRSGQRRDRQSV